MSKAAFTLQAFGSCALALGIVLILAPSELDTKTSSWIATPPDLRALGSALFCDRRYGRVFVHHNGAQPYHAARGFRGALPV
ncbi:MAG: DUF4256 domain-containing protein [Burkholderiaceae bacterium]|nr:DUF4256 domain-containing protein [Burkholderiaceae bacterium]